MLNKNKLVEMEQKILSFHNSASSKKSQENYEKYGIYCKFALKLITFIYVGVGIISILNPIAVILVTGNVVLPYGFKLPWMDEFSFHGYIVNFLYHLLQDYIVALGLFLLT